MGFINYSIDADGYGVRRGSRAFEYHQVDMSLTFPGGEVHPRLFPPKGKDMPYSLAPIHIEACLTCPSDVMNLLIVNDALRHLYPNSEIWASIPYFPYARQDRIAFAGEGLSLRVMAKLINDCKFSRVEVYDCHSAVSMALVNNLKHVAQEDVSWFLKNCYKELPILIAPDAGATKKVYDVAKTLGNEKPIYVGCKSRDPATGAISGFQINGDLEDFEGKDLLVIDDICDGGGTFIGLAEVLKAYRPKTLGLYVTHGIFSKGVDPLLKYYDRIFTTNSFRQDLSFFGPSVYVENIWRSLSTNNRLLGSAYGTGGIGKAHEE